MHTYIRIYTYRYVYRYVYILGLTRKQAGHYLKSGGVVQRDTPIIKQTCEVDALRVITISRECFERCCSNKITPPYHSNLANLSNLGFVTLRN